MRRALLVVPASAILIVGGCGSAPSDCTDNAACVPTVEAGADGSTDGGGVGEGADGLVGSCDPNVDPKTKTDCVDDGHGLFVAPTGNDTNAGTKASPLRTIGGAIAKSTAAKLPRIYACGGAYAEHVTIDAAHAVSLYGGFACADWAYTGERVRLTGDVAGVVLTIRDLNAAVRVFDVDVEALAGTDAITSSIAVFVSRSADVTFRRTKLVARDGKEGASGGAAPVGVATPADLTGSSGSGNNGGAEKTCTCTTGSFSTGGKGGEGAGGVSDGQPGKIAMATSSPATATGAAGTVLECGNTNQGGRNGSNAPQAGNGTAGITLGALDAQGWRPASGGKGIEGIPAQGGGGGAGQAGGGGGGGACGGCGGGAGGGGQAGGSSIALATFESTVHVTESQLAAGNAQKGGAGVAGAIGQDGGIRGNGAGTGCLGGNGGKGGTGGAGAGGAGGISTGVLSNAGAVDLDPASQAAIKIGTLGGAGTGGAPPTNDGKAGKAAPTLTATQL